MGKDHLQLLVQVASWYYEERLCQADIARRVGRSRSMVSRLLQEARDKGIVKIQVISLLINTVTELENHLRQTFGLTQAYVLADPPVDYPLLIRRLGELGAHALRQQLHDNIKISIMWGTTIYEVIWAMPNLALADATVIQMIGTVGRGNLLIDGPELARSLAHKLNATYCYLPAPIIVEDEAVANSFLQQSPIADVLNQVRQVDLALLGIGTLDAYFSYLKATGYVKHLDLVKLQEAGAAGSILGLFIDGHGQPLDVPINRRVIGFRDMAALQAIPTVMVVAGGIEKAPAILAALRGGYLDILVTDAVTATAVLSLCRNSDPPAARSDTTLKPEVLFNG